MKYRALGKTGIKSSILGLGAMRLPLNSSNPEDVDIDETGNMVEYAIEQGINMFDTALVYHTTDRSKPGVSETIMGELLKPYEDEVYLSTKMPSWNITSWDYFDKTLDYQLGQIQKDSMDLFFIHSIKDSYYHNIKEKGLYDFIDRAIDDGRIKHVGFSTHGSNSLLNEILNDYDKWEFCLTQVNYIDNEKNPGLDGLKKLSKLNIGTMIMEPLRGGRLVQNIPKEVQTLWDSADVKRTPVEWALQYLWNRDDVDCVLSCMNSLEQVKENIRIASTEDIISENDHELIREVARTYRTHLGNDCTRCGYCMPCPHGVDIINCLTEYNIAHMMGDPKASAMQYFSLIDDDSRADSCIQCMECIPFCTQMLNIPEELVKVHEYFGSEFDHF
jgi:predicted aldo/keto reductase-like oxidoreductase